MRIRLSFAIQCFLCCWLLVVAGERLNAASSTQSFLSTVISGPQAQAATVGPPQAPASVWFLLFNSPSEIATNTTFNVTARVNRLVGSPNGRVEFSLDENPLAVVPLTLTDGKHPTSGEVLSNASGLASLTLSQLSAGRHVIAARFIPDDNAFSETRIEIQRFVRSKRSFSLLLSHQPNPAVIGEPTLLRAVAQVDGETDILPTLFLDGAWHEPNPPATLIAVGWGLMTDGAYETVVSGLPWVMGIFTYRETLWTQTFASMQVNAVERQASNPSSISLVNTPASGNLGEPLGIVATISGGVFSNMTGYVSFHANGSLLGRQDLGSDGTATLNWDRLPFGSHQLSAIYSGDHLHLGSTSAVHTVEIGAPQIKASVESGLIRLQWPTVASAYSLEVLENSSSNSNWRTITNVLASGTTNEVALPPAAGDVIRLFRLRKPQ